MSTEIVLKKKTKRRGGLPTNITMSQVMVQRELSLHDIKFHDSELSREIVQTSQRVVNNQSCLPSAFGQSHQNAPCVVSQNNETRHDAHVPRSSHYLTVNSGWISQHPEKSDNGQISSHTTMTNVQPPLNGTPVLGSNGQIIGVNTGLSKYSSYKNNNHMAVQPILTSQEPKDEKKEMNVQHYQKHPSKEDESQTFSGLNQALTPEVMQKINEQQHIFIQQNQKQIEMAMKGFRSQLADNGNQNKQQNQNQYNQAQLVIQNGSVVKSNPAKTPPWQVKRNDSANSMTSPGPKMGKSDSLDNEEVNTNMSEDSSSSYSSYSSEQSVNHTVCSRVPPLPQHYSMLGQHWPPTIDTTKKRTKNSKGSKKKNNANDNKLVHYNSSNGVRLAQDSKGNSNEISNNNVPSFMEDPTGYLAQQTVLLNNTISRQVGNKSYENSQYENTVNSNTYTTQNNSEKKMISKSGESSNILRNQSNHIPNQSLSPTNMPDSSVLSDNSQCCKGCNNVSRRPLPMECSENQMRFKYNKHNIFKMDHENTMSSPKNNFDDNPITSTFVERCHMGDNSGPIQAATVSTSSITETLQLPEPSPTLSNSSRNTDTPHSSICNNQALSNSMYTLPSPAYSNNGSGKDSFSSNPSTPGSSQMYPYNSPGPPPNSSSQTITGTQMLHFISNHNVNKNLMEVDNISTMVGAKTGVRTAQEAYKMENRHFTENAMPGYCPPPHLGGGPAHSLIQTCYIQTYVTTMASGFSVTRDTVTSVLAGKAKTATTSINASQVNFVRPPPPPCVNLATSYAIPNNQPDPFINSVNLPTSYPLHIAGTTAQNMISKSPLEMVQHVIGNLTPSKSDVSNSHTPSLSQIRRSNSTTPGQILISSTGQIIVSSSPMPPPPPKTTTSSSLHTSSTNVSASVTQVIPAVGGVQSLVNQPAVVVNTLPAPFVIQPPMMAVDGQVVQQNAVLPQIVTGGIVSQASHETTRNVDVKNQMNFVQGVTMVSPESVKKRSKKKKNQNANITNMLQIAAPQHNTNNLMVHHSSPQHNTSPQFSPRSFQLSPNNNMSPTPMLQALTIVPGKSGTPAHIVMNGQNNSNNYGSQQILNTSPSQQINLLQPVNLINNTGGVMPNFPAFQQFIVPNLGGMVMTADGAALIQDNSAGVPMQLQLQAVNGQNVLTPVQNSGVFTAGTGGSMVIRAQNQQGKIIQSQHSPGAQFLSPNGQVMMNSPNFNGQLSPMLANLSPTNMTNMTFGTSPQLRQGAVQSQEYLQTNQTGQTLMVPMSPKQISISSAPNRASSTFVQNTTIVQQQTTLVSNSSNVHVAPVPASNARLSIDPNVLLSKKAKRQQRNQVIEEQKEELLSESAESESTLRHVRHSVSTQTLLNAARNKSPGSSPPDTTTHSPLAAQPDTTSQSPEPAATHDTSSSAMVQCVSSSEQDMTESRDQIWPTPNDFTSETDSQSMLSNVALMRQGHTHNSVESTDVHYSQNMSSSSLNCQNVLPMTSTYYERIHSYKRKNDFGDGSSYRSDKIMRTNGYSVGHGLPKDIDYNAISVNTQDRSYRHYQSASGSDAGSGLQKLIDRHNFSSGDDGERSESVSACQFAVGQVVWGAAPGHASWPGQVARLCADGRCEVRWFGARGLARLHPRALLTLSDGLDAHHAAREHHRKSRKLNTLLENAIQEAMAVLDKSSGTNKSTEEEEPVDDGESDPGSITETPKKSKKRDRSKNKDKRKNTNKVSRNKTDTRLRSAQ